MSPPRPVNLRSVGATDAELAVIVEHLTVALQPIVDLATGSLFAVEALARFAHAPGTQVEDVFTAAHHAGFGYLLEAACLRAALARRTELPAGVRLTVNVSPNVLLHSEVAQAWPEDLSDVLVEVTEHDVDSPDALCSELARLRRRGAAIAVDDVGTGYAGLLRLATLRPDFVKIDRSVVAGVRANPAQAAVLEALVNFSHGMGAAVIGEGVESLADVGALVEFDVDLGQGWAIGTPDAAIAPLSARVVDACRQARDDMLRRNATNRSTSKNETMHSIMSALSGAANVAELHTAAARAAVQLGVDGVGVSVLGADGMLREIASGTAAVDTSAYAIAAFPTTETVLKTGNAAEVHTDDPRSDPAEVEVLRRYGHASLLMLPLHVGEHPIGLLEIESVVHRRWSTRDVTLARRLAANIGRALGRLHGPATIQSASTSGCGPSQVS